MEKISSFQVDHEKLEPGLYLSRRDGDVTTFDLRFKKPNTGDLLSNAEVHSLEHVMATLLRNGRYKDGIIYFGPMGCQTGFYFLFNSGKLTDSQAVDLLREAFAAGAAWEGPMPGKSALECGNYQNLDTDLARTQCRYYAELIRGLDSGKTGLLNQNFLDKTAFFHKFLLTFGSSVGILSEPL